MMNKQNYIYSEISVNNKNYNFKEWNDDNHVIINQQLSNDLFNKKDPSIGYQMAIRRFEVSNLNLPFMVIKAQENNAIYNNTDWTLSKLSVTLEYRGDYVQEFLVTERNNLTVNLPLTPPYSPLGGEWGDNDNFNIVSPDQLIKMINDAFVLAYNGLSSPPPGSEPPRVLLQNGFLTLVSMALFYASEGVTFPIKIYVNNHLFPVFNNFNFMTHNPYNIFGADKEFIILPIHDDIKTIGTDDWIYYKQSAMTLYNLSPYRNILIKSNLPINNLIETYNTLKNKSSNLGYNPTNVLLSFRLMYQKLQDINTGAHIYNPQKLSWVSINCNYSFRDMLFSIYLQKDDGSEHKYVLIDNESMNIEFVFRKKKYI